MFDGLVGGILNLIGGERRNAAQEDLADKQMEFQAHMSNSAYQRAVADLGKAGLNPMLAYRSPASSPGGAMAQVENTLGSAVNAAQQGSMVSAQVENLKETNEKIRAETSNVRADERLKDSQALINAVQVPYIQQQERTSTATASELASREAVQNQQISLFQAQANRILEQNALTRAEVEHVKEQIKNAVEQGHKIRADTSNTKVNTLLSELEVPHARNLATSEQSAFKKNVSPYLIDVQRLFGSGSSLRRSIRP